MQNDHSMKIIITNNLRLSAVPNEFREMLMEKLRFTNPKWLENERMGRWNRGTPRELRFFDKIRGDGLWVPRGCLRQLILLCRRHGVSYRIEDQRRTMPPVDFKFNGRLKPFQQTAVDEILAKEFGTLSAPTGSGKTVMALYMIARRHQPALIVVHTKELAHQWMKGAERFLNIPVDDIGFIGGGKRSVGEKMTVALVQSLYKIGEEVAEQTGFLVVDECHRCPSRTFTDAVTCFDSRYMLGLSATPYRRDKLSKLIFWHLGDVHHDIDKGRLIESGDVLPIEVVVRETNFKPYYDPINEYSKMLSELTLNDERNRLIVSDVAHEVRNSEGICLVLSDRKSHCETLQAVLRYKHDVSSELLTGDLTGSQRQDVVNRLNQGRIRVLVATGQLIGEGFDCRELTTLFFATPVRFSGRVLQYLGRVLRPAPGKEKAKVYDYVDANVDVLKAAARARQKVYSG